MNITATVTRPEPQPEPVRPRLQLRVGYANLARIWVQSILTSERSPHWDIPVVPASDRLITIPADAEAEKHAAYVKALEAFHDGWGSPLTPLHQLSAAVVESRAEWEAERGKA